jgi:hypothetical protein
VPDLLRTPEFRNSALFKNRRKILRVQNLPRH